MMGKRIALALLIAAAGAGRECAAASAGAEPFNFLFIDANARAVGMGGAYTALAADANALLYNPAGLARVRRHEATFMHNQYFQDISQEYAGFAARQGWGLGLNFLNFGKVQRTTIGNPTGAGLDQAGLIDLMLSAGYARETLVGLSAGGAFKIIRETIDGISAQGYAFDIGAMYDPESVRGLTLGLALQNMGPAVTFQRAKENLPLNLRAGAAYKMELGRTENTVSFDLTRERSEAPLFSIGLESVLYGAMPLRLGFSSRNDAGPGVTAGIGWRIGEASIDYAFAPFGDLGAAHRMSATVRFGYAPWGVDGGRAFKVDTSPRPALEQARSPVRRRLEPDEPRDEPPPAAAEVDALIRSGRYSSAEHALNENKNAFLSTGGGRVFYWDRSGTIFMKRGDLKNAIQAFKKAARAAGAAGPALARAHLNLGLCRLKAGSPRKAQTEFRKALDASDSPETRQEAERLLRTLEFK